MYTLTVSLNSWKKNISRALTLVDSQGFDTVLGNRFCTIGNFSFLFFPFLFAINNRTYSLCHEPLKCMKYKYMSVFVAQSLFITQYFSSCIWWVLLIYQGYCVLLSVGSLHQYVMLLVHVYVLGKVRVIAYSAEMGLRLCVFISKLKATVLVLV